MISAQNFTVGRNDFGSKIGSRVFQLIERRHGTEDTYSDAKEEQNDEQENRSKDNPQILYGVRLALLLRFFLFIIHVLLFFNIQSNIRDAFQRGFTHGLFDFEMIGSFQGEKKVLV